MLVGTECTKHHNDITILSRATICNDFIVFFIYLLCCIVVMTTLIVLQLPIDYTHFKYICIAIFVY